MPLSEHEQRLFEQIERALSDDPKFASQMQGAGARASARRRMADRCGGCRCVGLALVLVGVNTTMWIGAVGFAVMVGAVAFALDAPASQGRARHGPAGRQRPPGPPPASHTSKPRSSKSGGSFMNRMEERWDKRRDDGY